MRSNYKKLGNYIQQVNNRNKNLKVTNLQGLSTKKEFRSSVSNIIGTDMSKYKIVTNNQFVYMPVTDTWKGLAVALYNGCEPIIVSQIYKVFEIVDISKLLPEYLMMWFKRPEIDRYARYKSHGSAREIFDWEEMCDVELPVPSIEKQREIVAEYYAITNRIKLNEQLNQKLEETAQAIYKEWFVDFEFPHNFSHSELDSESDIRPYKSGGGEMVYCEELEKEIPKGWDGTKYKEVMNFTTGKLNSNAAVIDGDYPFFTCSSETYKTNTYSFDTEAVLLAGNNASAIYPLKIFKGKFDAYQRTYVITSNSNRLSNQQIYFSIKNELDGFKGTSSGTATKFLTMQILNNLKIVLADKETCKKFRNVIKEFFALMDLSYLELEKLSELKELLLSKMTTVEGVDSAKRA